MSEWKTIEQIWRECEGRPVWVELRGEASKSLLYRKDENEYWLVERDNCVFVLGHSEARIYQEI